MRLVCPLEPLQGMIHVTGFALVLEDSQARRPGSPGLHGQEVATDDQSPQPISGHSFRTRIIRAVQLSSEFRSRRCRSTFTSSHPYGPPEMNGRMGRSDVVNPPCDSSGCRGHRPVCKRRSNGLDDGLWGALLAAESRSRSTRRPRAR